MEYMKKPAVFAAEMLALYDGDAGKAADALLTAVKQKAFPSVGVEWLADVLIELAAAGKAFSQGESDHA